MIQLIRPLFLLVTIYLTLIGGFSYAGDAEPVVKFSKISENFWVLHQGQGYGANVGLVTGDDGILLIDSGTKEAAPKILKAIRKISNKPIRYVINTHQHGDHRGGNEIFVAEGATIIYPDYIKFASRYTGASRDIRFKDQMSLKMNGEIINIYHQKSHTWNDAVVHLENNNAVFTGDNHATNWGPQVGARGMRSHRDVMGLVKGLSNDKTLIVPGHKKLADLEQVNQYDQKTEEWYELVLAMHNQGKSIDTIFEDKRISDMLKWFHGGKMPASIPEDRLRARVEYTIFAEETSKIKLSPEEMDRYVGFYQLSDGSQVEIIRHEFELYAFKAKTFMAYLMPISKTRFDFNGWNEKEHLLFELNSTGLPTELRFSVNDKVEFSAAR